MSYLLLEDINTNNGLLYENKLEYLNKHYPNGDMNGPSWGQPTKVEQALAVSEKYADWLLKNDQVPYEPDDCEFTNEILVKYERLIRSPELPQKFKNIYQYKTIDELSNVIETNKHLSSKRAKRHDAVSTGASLIYDSGDIKIQHLTTPEAMSEIARSVSGTALCIHDIRAGDHYSKTGGIIYVEINGNPAYFVGNSDIRNIWNEPIDESDLPEIVREIVKKTFNT
jgi:hypothetical protein